MKLLLVPEINILYLMVAIIFRLLGYQIAYLTLAKGFDLDKIGKYLCKFGIWQLTYENVDYRKQPFAIYFDVEEKLCSLVEVLVRTPVHEFACKQLFAGKSVDISRDMAIVVKSHLKTIVYRNCELLFFARCCRDNRECASVSIFSFEDRIIRNITGQEHDDENLCHVILVPLFYSHLVISQLTKVARASIQLMYRRFGRGNNNVCPAEPTENTSSDNISRLDLDSFKVAYFPHRGIKYGNLYVKDQYYSPDINSSFSPGRILHLSLYDDKKAAENSFEYYRQNNIPNLAFESLANTGYYSKLGLILLYVRKTIFSAGNMFDYPATLSIYLTLIFQITSAISRFRKLKNLKIVLLGYDVLFPKPVAMACRILGIKTVATQERFILPFVPNFNLILDHYYVSGEKVKQRIIMGRNHSVRDIQVVGLTRMDGFYDSRTTSNADDMRRDMMKDRFKWICLALDYQSTPLPYNNARCIANNWKKNMKYYKDMIRLAGLHKDTLFLIKGKNLNYTRLEYFKQVISEMEETDNMRILHDLDVWTPYLSVLVSDYSVALHTSLGDEMLSIGKPVIFYDYTGYPEIFFNYDNLPVIARNFDELSDLVSKVENNAYLSEKDFEYMYGNFYERKNQGEVKKQIVGLLEEVLAEEGGNVYA